MKKILYIIGFLLITNAVFSQAKIGTDGSVEPTGNFPAMKDQFFKGGMRVVADTTARNAIPSLFRKNGMLVYDQALKKLWVLDSTVSPIWSEFASGSSVDSSTYATRARLYKVADSLGAIISSTSADSSVFSTKAYRQKGLDSVQAVNAATYVPYTGATANVDLGAFTLHAQSLAANGTNGSGFLRLRHQASDATASGQTTSLFANSSGYLKVKNDGLSYYTFATPITADRTYTFQDKSGTVAHISDITDSLPSAVSAIQLNLSGAIHSTPVNFTRSGRSWSATATLADQSAFTIFRRGSGTGTPSFGSIDSSYFGGSFANQVRGVGDSRYGLLGSANTWTAKNTFTDSIVGVNQRLTGNIQAATFNGSALGSYAYRSSGLAELSGATFTGAVTSSGTIRTTAGIFSKEYVASGSAGSPAYESALVYTAGNTPYGLIQFSNEYASSAATGLRIRLTNNTNTTYTALEISNAGAATFSGALTATAQGNNITIGVDSSVTTTTYTLVLGDAGYLKRCSNASAITITVPTNASVAFPIGTTIYFSQQGAGKVSVSPATSDVTIQSEGNLLGTAGQHAVIALIKVNVNRWILCGNRG